MSKIVSLPGPASPPRLTTTEEAIVDFERQKDAHMARRQQLAGDPAIPTLAADGKGPYYDPATLDALTRPVRIEISFEDPIKTRQQLEVLMGICTEVLVVTGQHELGISRQRLRAREIMKSGADALTYMSGKTPTGRKKPGAR